MGTAIHHFDARELEDYRVKVATKAAAEAQSYLKACMGRTLDQLEDAARESHTGYKIPIWKEAGVMPSGNPMMMEPEIVVISAPQVRAMRQILCGPRPN